MVHESAAVALRTGPAESASPDFGISTLPFKLNQDRRHHIPRQQHKVTNWPAYEAGLSAWQLDRVAY